MTKTVDQHFITLYHFVVTLHLSASSGSAETEQPTGGREISDGPAQLEESPGGQLSCHG